MTTLTTGKPVPLGLKRVNAKPAPTASKKTQKAVFISE